MCAFSPVVLDEVFERVEEGVASLEAELAAPVHRDVADLPVRQLLARNLARHRVQLKAPQTNHEVSPRAILFIGFDSVRVNLAATITTVYIAEVEPQHSRLLQCSRLTNQTCWFLFFHNVQLERLSETAVLQFARNRTARSTKWERRRACGFHCLRRTKSTKPVLTTLSSTE